MLKVIVDFLTLLIEVEGAKTPVGIRSREDPAGAQAMRRLHEPLAPGAEISSQF
ncbi:hypothetical protein [Bacillus sp. MUM 116]|uniref:hypothetical protein n=1 Tax=Bacillus sp. MUM 116 TaxID=1678002 RepID=UPI0015A71B96|nr:hypothetical protein [Bacillus sp. MUM 116]